MSEIRNCVVTGASRGIGHATAKLFMARGWRLVTCSREEIPPECRRNPVWVEHIPTDLFDPAGTAEFVERAVTALGGGGLHALVNNAGWSPKTETRERLGCLNGDLDLWHRVFELNLFAPLRLARGFAAALRRGRGAIVNVTSIAGHQIHPFAGSAYAVSKAALSALTREMAAEFAQLGVRVNAIAPGEIETAMVGPDYEMLVPRIPMGRMGTPEDVANAIYALCDPDGFGYATGTEMFLTGGQHL
ncbi:MAG: SDR family oxidoreductase [Thalassobaculales bacterium]